MIVIPGPG